MMNNILLVLNQVKTKNIFIQISNAFAFPVFVPMLC